jgi:hypothetical protein
MTRLLDVSAKFGMTVFELTTFSDSHSCSSDSIMDIPRGGVGILLCADSSMITESMVTVSSGPMFVGIL